jgi:hypothetical protein
LDPFSFVPLLAALLAFIWVIISSGREHRRKLDAERRQAERKAREERSRQMEERHRKTRRDARERARFAFPDLLDENEAKGFDESHPGRRELSGADCDLIYEARNLVRHDIESIEAANRNCSHDYQHASPIAAKLKLLDKDLTTLGSVYEDHGYNKLKLGAPARVIDCGEAGEIRLYTVAQVEVARQESGLTNYLTWLDQKARAQELAKEIVERARMLEQKEREAEEARLASVTTKLDDLPPLSAKDD